MKIHRTNYSRFLNSFFSYLSQAFVGPWKIRSIGLLSLLVGFYLSSTLTSYFLQISNQRILVVFCLFILIELSVRVRKPLYTKNKQIILLTLDNFRIGICYAIVLEAFKLGS